MADTSTTERIEALEVRVKRLREEVTHLNQCLWEKNRDLDALYHVWCSGGCEAGVARYPGTGPLTPAIVARAVINTQRLWQWYLSRKGRDYYGPGGFREDRGHTWEGLERAWKEAREELVGALREQQRSDREGNSDA